MNTHPCILVLTLALTGWAGADLPKKVLPTKYSTLVTNSPFTSKPPPPVGADPVDELADYALGGVSPIIGGWHVTLLNKKKPDERITLDSDRPREGFKILGVTRKPGDPLGTVVRLTIGSSTGTVGFDEKLLTLAAPPAPKAAPKLPPGIHPQAQPQAQPGQPNPGIRQPRPRVVPPPTSGGAAPQAPQAPQGQSNSSSHRPDRRGGR
jgi:hypothetical protein